MSSRVLLVPEHRVGRGVGHLVRCLRIARSNPDRYRVLLPLESLDAVKVLVSQLGYPETATLCVRSSEEAGALSFAVLDKPWANASDLPITGGAPVVGLDVGGEARKLCCILVDSLPRISEPTEPNCVVAPVEPLQAGSGAKRGGPGPAAVRDPSAPSGREVSSQPATAEGSGRVLVTFGGDDPANLTAPTVRALIGSCGVDPAQITVRRPSRLSREVELPAGVTLEAANGALQAELPRFDAVCTSFGMTAFEAVAAGCRVILINPTRYHARLAGTVGFPEAGTGSVSPRRLRAAFRRPGGAVPERVGEYLRRHSAEAFFASLSPSGTQSCPVCGTGTNRVIARFRDRSYKRCGACGLLYMVRLTPPPIAYEERYFFEEYRAQYGKTYLEDFGHIKAMGKSRLGRIASALQSPLRGIGLLDIGCAYGPFLAAAQETGAEAYGIDVSEEAVRYVREELGYYAAVSGVEQFSPEDAFGRSTFDVITMWYVIEHLAELRGVLTQIASMLAPGGVFAFSTPSGSGVSARRDFIEFLRRSPADHYTLWVPKHVAGILSRFGLDLVSMASTGHHPERFPGILGSEFPPVRRLTGWLSRRLALGDTFEVYARKRAQA